MSSTRTTARVVGILYLVTHVTSIGAVVLYGQKLGASDHRVFAAAVLEVILAVAMIGTAVALYPVVKRENEAVALGYVALRLLEAGVILVGVVSALAFVTLRQNGTDAAAGQVLVAVHDWTFLIGPGFVCGTNTVFMAYLMYRSRLVPRFIAVLGLVGGPLIIASNAAVMFGAYEQWSTPAGLAAVPVFAWELTLALVLIVKGFATSASPPSIAGRPEVTLPVQAPALATA